MKLLSKLWCSSRFIEWPFFESAVFGSGLGNFGQLCSFEGFGFPIRCMSQIPNQACRKILD